MPDDRVSTSEANAEQERKGAWVKIGPGGRLVIPSAMRRALGLSDGEHVQARIVDGELRLIPRETVCRRIQEKFAKLIPPGVNLVDDLIAERRREAEREERGD